MFKRINILLAALLSVAFFGSCKEEWLDTYDPSDLTAEGVLVNKSSIDALLLTCSRTMRNEWTAHGSRICTEFQLSDMAVDGVADSQDSFINLDLQLLPSGNLSTNDGVRILDSWEELFTQVKYANLVIKNSANLKDETEAVRNSVLGSGYFHRAYAYYRLITQFGDVPYLDWVVTSVRKDYNSNDRWGIIKRECENLEFAYKWCTDNEERGHATKGGSGALLMKYYMLLNRFDDAIKVGQEIVKAHPLMTQRFTANKTKPGTNLMFDLHSVEAKKDMSNTEGLMYVVSEYKMGGASVSNSMANCVPKWARASATITPDGKTGCTTKCDANDAKANPEYDILHTYGQGNGRVRPTYYFQYGIWTDKEKNDLRGVYNRDSWKCTEDLIYNATALKGKSEYYGQHVVRPANISVEDSIQCYYQWPHYKVFVPDPTANVFGGNTCTYVYRSAEVYLLMAECYYWLKQNDKAAEMMNVVRQRAGADPLKGSDINIGEILNERARELYMEEARHDELVRISYIFAKYGYPCEVFGGRKYSMDKFSGDGGTNANIKKEGVNFYYDWIMKVNDFYNKGVKQNYGEYKMSVHHVLWPIPQKSILANANGVINQNVGYPGAENNITPDPVPETGRLIQ